MALALWVYIAVPLNHPPTVVTTQSLSVAALRSNSIPDTGTSSIRVHTQVETTPSSSAYAA